MAAFANGIEVEIRALTGELHRPIVGGVGAEGLVVVPVKGLR